MNDIYKERAWDIKTKVTDKILENYDFTQLHNLKSAYGNSDEIAECVEKLCQENDSEKWLYIFEEEIFNEHQLVHQGTFYQITVGVLPHLIDMLCKRGFDYHTNFNAFILIGYAIMCENESVLATVSEELQTSYKSSLDKLKFLANDLIKDAPMYFKPKYTQEVYYFVASLFAVLRNKKLGEILFDKAMLGDMEFSCNNCEQGTFYISLNNASEGVESIIPADVYNSKDEDFIWLSELFKSIGQENFVPELKYIFGTYTCPHCKTRLRVIDLG